MVGVSLAYLAYRLLFFPYPLSLLLLTPHTTVLLSTPHPLLSPFLASSCTRCRLPIPLLSYLYLRTSLMRLENNSFIAVHQRQHDISTCIELQYNPRQVHSTPLPYVHGSSFRGLAGFVTIAVTLNYSITDFVNNRPVVRDMKKQDTEFCQFTLGSVLFIFALKSYDLFLYSHVTC